jgi:hypothetical protein
VSGLLRYVDHLPVLAGSWFADVALCFRRGTVREQPVLLGSAPMRMQNPS